MRWGCSLMRWLICPSEIFRDMSHFCYLCLQPLVMKACIIHVILEYVLRQVYFKLQLRCNVSVKCSLRLFTIRAGYMKSLIGFSYDSFLSYLFILEQNNTTNVRFWLAIWFHTPAHRNLTCAYIDHNTTLFYVTKPTLICCYFDNVLLKTTWTKMTFSPTTELHARTGLWDRL